MVSCPCQTEQEAKQNGCTQPVHWPLWEDEDYEVYSCPVHLLTEAISAFVARLDWMEEYGCHVAYEKLPARFVEAAAYYNRRFSVYRQQVKK